MLLEAWISSMDEADTRIVLIKSNQKINLQFPMEEEQLNHVESKQVVEPLTSEQI